MVNSARQENVDVQADSHFVTDFVAIQKQIALIVEPAVVEQRVKPVKFVTQVSVALVVVARHQPSVVPAASTSPQMETTVVPAARNVQADAHAPVGRVCVLRAKYSATVFAVTKTRIVLTVGVVTMLVLRGNYVTPEHVDSAAVVQHQLSVVLAVSTSPQITTTVVRVGKNAQAVSSARTVNVVVVQGSLFVMAFV